MQSTRHTCIPHAAKILHQDLADVVVGVRERLLEYFFSVCGVGAVALFVAADSLKYMHAYKSLQAGFLTSYGWEKLKDAQCQTRTMVYVQCCSF